MSVNTAIGDGRINLEQQRKRARELLRQMRAGQPDALRRMHAHGLASTPPCLADAQLLIARELGFASWPKLKAHVEAVAFAARQPTFVADDEAATLHLRCGNDIAHSLRLAGFQGEFRTFTDPLAMGPVSDLPLSRYMEQRAAFISRSFAVPPAQALADVRREYALLERLHEWPRVVLWCEGDAYDQLFLVRVLAGLRQLPRRLELIEVERLAGVGRFVGIGQLAPDLLAWLWPQRRSLGEEALRQARQVWQAYSGNDPRHWAGCSSEALPLLGAALRRELCELPGLDDGLSLTERLSLSIVAAREGVTQGQVFARLTLQDEPLPWLGDLMFHALLRPLIDSSTPLLHERLPQRPWAERPLALTELGRQVLAGQRHWLDCAAAERWVGGVCLRPGQAHWCLDRHGRPLLREARQPPLAPIG